MLENYKPGTITSASLAPLAGGMWLAGEFLEGGIVMNKVYSPIFASLGTIVCIIGAGTLIADYHVNPLLAVPAGFVAGVGVGLMPLEVSLGMGGVSIVAGGLLSAGLAVPLGAVDLGVSGLKWNSQRRKSRRN